MKQNLDEARQQGGIQAGLFSRESNATGICDANLPPPQEIAPIKKGSFLPGCSVKPALFPVKVALGVCLFVGPLIVSFPQI